MTFKSMTIAALALPALLFSSESQALEKKNCQSVTPSTYLCNKVGSSAAYGFSGVVTASDGTCQLAQLTTSSSSSCGGKSASGKYDITLTSLTTTALTKGCKCVLKGSVVAAKKSNPSAVTNAATAKKPATDLNPAPAATTAKNGSLGAPLTGAQSPEDKSTDRIVNALNGKPETNLVDLKDAKGNVIGKKETVTGRDGETVSYYDANGKWKSSETTSTKLDTSDETTYSFTKGNKKYSYATAEEAQAAASEKGSGTITIGQNGQKVVVDAKTGKTVKKSTDISNLSEEDRKKLNDECRDSQLVAIKMKDKDGITRDFSCDATTTMVKGVTIGNQVLQTAGAMVVNTIGNQVAASAQNGTASSVQKGVAKAAKTAFTYQTAVGVLNAAATVKLMQKTAQHKRNAAEIQAYQEEQLAAAENHNYLTSKSGAVGPEVANLNANRADKAYGQQKDAQKSAAEATMAAITGFATAAMQATNAKLAQKGAEKLARNYASIENQLKGNAILWDSSGPVVGATNDAASSAATSGGASQSVSDTATDDTGGPSALGDGNDTGAGGGDVTPLTPGAFKAAGGGASGGGSGGGGMGGGGSGGGGPAANPEDPKAAYASAFETKERYESGGGPAGAKGAGGKGGKDDGIGIDMSAFAALLNPKSLEDTVKENEQGILAYGKGGARVPASADENGSYLDKNADLFQRIHETMSEKHRKGQVGI